MVSYKCNRCQKVFPKKREMMRHLNRKFKCDPSHKKPTIHTLNNINYTVVQSLSELDENTLQKNSTKGTYICDKCNKAFARKDSLKRHISITCKGITCGNINIDTNVTNMYNTTEYIYLLQEREFIRINEQTYKVGRTSQPFPKRFNGYPKDSELFMMERVFDCVTAETLIINKFKGKFKQMSQYGKEYFNGDVDEMKQIIHETISEMTNIVKNKSKSVKNEPEEITGVDLDVDIDIEVDDSTEKNS